MGYLANFMVYTLAMVGVIVVALLVFKNATTGGCVKKSKYLKVVDTMSLGARKTLYIVSTGRENFLIAGDVDRTTLISKLESSCNPVVQEESLVNPMQTTVDIEPRKSFQETMSSLKSVPSYMDKSKVGIKSSMLSAKTNAPYTSVMKSLAEKMK